MTFFKRHIWSIGTAAVLMAFTSILLARVTGTPPSRSAPDVFCVGRSGAEVCVDNDGNVIPTVDNDTTLGTASLRWATINALDFTAGDDVTVTDALTVSGATTLQRVTFGLQLSTAPRTSVTLVLNSTGTLVFNTTYGALCLSTGSLQTSFVLSTAATTACPS